MNKKFWNAVILVFVCICTSRAVFAGENKESIATTAATDLCAFINGKQIDSYHVNGKLMIPIDALSEYGFAVVPIETQGHLQYQVTFSEEEAEKNDLNIEAANEYLQYFAAGGEEVILSENTVLAKNEEFPCYQVDGRDIVVMDLLKQFGDLLYQEEQRFAYAAVGAGEEETIYIKKAESIAEDKAYQKQREFAFTTETAGSIEEVIEAAKGYIKANVDSYFNSENYTIRIPNENLITLTYCIDGFETDYIFHIRLENGQAVSLMEGNERPARVSVPNKYSVVYLKLLDIDRKYMGEILEQEVIGKYEEETKHCYWFVSTSYQKVDAESDKDAAHIFGGDIHQFDFQKETK